MAAKKDGGKVEAFEWVLNRPAGGSNAQLVPAPDAAADADARSGRRPDRRRPPRPPRVKLGTGIIILPQRNPLVLAKELASVDVVSGGRLIFGLGIGYLKPEFDALGIPFEHKGARAMEYLEAILAAWTAPHPEYEGRFVAFRGIDAQPRPVQQPHPPIVIGGRTPAAYRRAASHANGWYGFSLDLAETTECLAGLRSALAETSRPAALGTLEISITPRGPVDRHTVERFAELGVHRLIPFWPLPSTEALTRARPPLRRRGHRARLTAAHRRTRSERAALSHSHVGGACVPLRACQGSVRRTAVDPRPPLDGDAPRAPEGRLHAVWRIGRGVVGVLLARGRRARPRPARDSGRADPHRRRRAARAASSAGASRRRVHRALARGAPARGPIRVSAARIAGAVAVLGAAAMLVAVALRHTRTAPPPVPADAAVTELLDRGDRLASVGRPYRAVEYYLRAQRVAPDDPETWRRLANAALAAEQPEHARQAAARLLALTPNDIAAVALRDAAAALPTPSGNRRGRPRALTRRRCTAAKRMVDAGKLDDAAIVLAAAAWLDEDAAMPQNYLANVAYLQGRVADAVAYQRRAVELAPRSGLFRRNLEALEAALTPTPGS